MSRQARSKPAEAEKVIRMQWSPVQNRILQTKTRHVDAEGGIRSGKTTAAVWKVITWAQEYPGIRNFIGRWSSDATRAQLAPEFWNHCPRELLAQDPWNSQEEYVLFANGSRVYIRGLKSSDESARYVKTAGLTLALIWIDQPEEVPLDVIEYLKGRMSQPGFPHQLLLTPNPAEPGHWLSDEFPEDNSRKGYEYIHLSTYDNRRNLGDDYIESLEASYPEGHPMRRRLLYGLRGAAGLGTPVYGKIFKPPLHVVEVEPLVSVPILEAWDFSFNHPAVLWAQYTPWGSLDILGHLQGDREYLEDFAPKAIARRTQLFGQNAEYWTTSDPSGAVPTSHGMKKTAIQVLRTFGVFPQVVPNANQPEVRAYCVENIAALMLKLTPEGAALRTHPRCDILVEGFQTGYTYPEKLIRGHRVPNKDGYYDHLQNCLEYLVLKFVAGQMPHERTQRNDPDDMEDAFVRRMKARRQRGRSGY